MDLGLKDKRGPLKVWVKCGKNRKGSDTSTAYLTSILNSWADLHFYWINFFPIRVALKIKCPWSLLIFVMESKSPRIKTLGFRGKSMFIFVFTFLLLFFRINALPSLDAPLKVHKESYRILLNLPTHSWLWRQQIPLNQRDKFLVQSQIKPVSEVSDRNWSSIFFLYTDSRANFVHVSTVTLKNYFVLSSSLKSWTGTRTQWWWRPYCPRCSVDC